MPYLQHEAVKNGLQTRPALRPLARRNFRLLLAGSAIVGVLTPLHLMTQLFWVSQNFPASAVFYSSVLAASRGAGMVLFSLIGGAIADRADRTRVLLVTESLSQAANAVTAALMILSPLGEGSVALVAVATFAAAGVQSIDGPARSATVPAAAGRENIGAAIALLSVSSQLTMPISLPIAGIMNQVFSPGAVYASSLLAWLAILPLISMLRIPPLPAPSARISALRSMGEGLAYTRAHRPILAVVSILLVVQVIGLSVATPLGPIFEIEVLGFDSAQVGLMGAAWGLGSLAASIVLTRANHLALRAATLVVVATLFGVAALGFGYSRFVPLTAISDFGMGCAFTATGLVASTLIQHLVADEMRGRVLSFFPLSIGIAQVMTAVASAAGEVIGLALLLPILGWLVIAGSLLLTAWYREFLSRRVEPESLLLPAG